jgi:hypothetical protein
MKKFEVLLEETIYGRITVEAESVSEAEKKALESEGVEWEDETITTQISAVKELEDDEE